MVELLLSLIEVVDCASYSRGQIVTAGILGILSSRLFSLIELCFAELVEA